MRIDPDIALGAMLRSDFGFFVKVMIEKVFGIEYDHNWHIDAIIHTLEQVRRGKSPRQVITLPPRHLKTLIVSVCWPAWELGRDPSRRFMGVSYGQRLADKHGRECLKVMEHRYYRLAFPNLRLVRTVADDFETSEGGGHLATSITGQITGRGAHFIIIDDPIKSGEARSEVSRETVNEALDGSLESRLDSPDKDISGIIIVMQRLHEDDLAGMVLRRGGWNELRLAAIATRDELVPLTRGRFYQRREGCALHPARQSPATLEEKRARDWYNFSAQWQQEPVPRQGNFVMRDWIQFYDETPKRGLMVQSWDTASMPGVGNDFTVGITALYHNGRYYILDVYRARVAFGGLHRALIELCRRYGVERLIIEQAGSGIQLIQRLEEELPQGVPWPIKVKPFESKEIRFEAQASRIQAGEVLLPRGAPWVAEFIDEIVGFPNKRFDDQADALAQMLANPPLHSPPPINAGPELMDEFGAPPSDDDDDDPWAAYDEI